MAQTEEKTSSKAAGVAKNESSPAPATEKKAAKQEASHRKAVVEAFMAMKPKERSDVYNELASAINHDNDLHSQGMEADNSKYEALLNG